MGWVLISHSLYAQPISRFDDHFQRNKRLIAIDLNEKINFTLVECNNQNDRFYDVYQRYSYRCGLVSALLESFLSDKIPGFDPNDLQKNITSRQFLALLKPLLDQLEDEQEAEKESTFSTTDSEFTEEENESHEPDFELMPDKEAREEKIINLNIPQLRALQNKIEIIEDVILDSKTSSQCFLPTYLIIKWVNPYGVGIQLNLVAFKYSDVIKVLDQTQWKNRFNDAEDKSIRQVFDLRLFNFIVINYSGSSSKNLFQAEKVKEKIVNFEHDLWEY